MSDELHAAAGANSVKEVWLPIAGFEGLYEVSDLGRVRSLRRVTRYGSSARNEPLIMALSETSNGYVGVSITRLGERIRISVHREVLRAFDGEPAEGQEASHLNGRRPDNRLANLAWANRSENHQHKLAHGTAQRGERCGKHVLSQREVDEIRSRHILGSKACGTRPLAREFGVSQACIQQVVRRKTWVPVPKGLPLPSRGDLYLSALGGL